MPNRESMTVAQLIEQLQKLPQHLPVDMEVMFECDECCSSGAGGPCYRAVTQKAGKYGFEECTPQEAERIALESGLIEDESSPIVR